MDPRQIAVCAVLAAAMGMFVWGRWRFDLVALLALLAAVALGVVDAGAAFSGFSHPAVVTVAAVLLISRSLTRSGAANLFTRLLLRIAATPLRLRLALLSGSASVSAFINNVGALTLLMPVALGACRKLKVPPSRVLMPLSFCTMLGGMATLIGTPPNIIVANYRADLTGTPFGLFDFSPVGLTVAACGVLFVALIGWRLIPAARTGRPEPEDLFDVERYVAELEVGEDSPLVGHSVGSFVADSGLDIQVLGLFRGERQMWGLMRLELMQPGDVLLVMGGSDPMHQLTETRGLKVMGEEVLQERLRRADMALAEVVLKPGSPAVGTTPGQLKLRSRYGVNLLAVGREGVPVRTRLRDVVLHAGDVLLMQGDADGLPEVAASLGALPLASRKLHMNPRRLLLPLVVFATAMALIATGTVPAALALAGAAVVMIVTNVLPYREMYDAVDFPVVVLLAAMIPVGEALHGTGAAGVLAGWLADVAGGGGPHLLLGLVLLLAMFLSDVMNNAATAVVMAPVAADLAARLGVNADPFLMAVAVGASCAFLTPVGHQNNTLVMGPGGYRFGDYWRLGLPLEAVIFLVAVPLIPMVWPF
ncbi:MAG: SLC13 family permease [Nitrospirota bacterium]|nr:SLC13 family permease [Nitrospirota bacterium]